MALTVRFNSDHRTLWLSLIGELAIIHPAVTHCADHKQYGAYCGNGRIH